MRTAIAKKLTNVSNFENTIRQRFLLFMLHVAVLVAFTAFIMWTPIQHAIVANVPNFNIYDTLNLIVFYILFISPWGAVRAYTWTNIVQKLAQNMGSRLTKIEKPMLIIDEDDVDDIKEDIHEMDIDGINIVVDNTFGKIKFDDEDIKITISE